MSREELLLWITAPLYTIAIAAEIFIGIKSRRELYSFSDTLMSVWFGIGGAAFDLLTKGFCFLILDWCNDHAIYKPDLLIHYPILGWVIVFIGQDFCFYWLHRVEHQSRFFWAVHSNHHSSPHYNFAVALRSSVLQPLYRYAFYIPVAFLGFKGIDIMFMYAVNQVYQFWLHTETIPKLGWFEKIFVTPSHHRVHHASNIKYLDRNMGQVLIIWDKLFGTFQEEQDEEKPVFGLTKPLVTKNPIRAVFHEFINIAKDLKKGKRFSEKLRYVFDAPGWSHDNSTKTSNQLRLELKEEKNKTHDI